MAFDNWLLLLTYLIAVNAISFLAFAWDKQSARSGMWRLSESTLLGLAAFGGSIGAKIGQKTLRHKTVKEPFRTILNGLIGLQLIALSALSIPAVRTAVRDWINAASSYAQ
jgi:uncharacterized membrane protein YsdA (DUF1294 family)